MSSNQCVPALICFGLTGSLENEPWIPISHRDSYEFQEQPDHPGHPDDAHNRESAPFLAQDEGEGWPPRDKVPEKTGLQYYTFVLRQRRFVAGVTCYMCYSMMVASFDTTLPLHVRDTFGWGSLPAGLMFVALNAPGVVLAPLAGALKDRVGTCLPSVIGFSAIAPFILLLGVPGDARFSQVGSGPGAQALYTISMVMIGCSIPLLNSIGTLEVSRESSPGLFTPPLLALTPVYRASVVAVDEIQTSHPGIFGPQGGHSRAVGIANMSWTLGIFFGPIISGPLADHVGYLEMNSVLGIYFLPSCSSLSASPY